MFWQRNRVLLVATSRALHLSNGCVAKTEIINNIMSREQRPFCTLGFTPSITWCSAMGEWPDLSSCLPFMYIHVLLECQRSVRSLSKARCCWQTRPIWWPEAKSLSLYVLCKPFPRPFLPVMSVSYCLLAAELFSLDPWSFQDSEVLEGFFMCSAG